MTYISRSKQQCRWQKSGESDILHNYWTRLSKTSWFISGEQINYWLRQIVDLRDTGKSRYFAITVFSNCLIIRSPGNDLPFLRKSDRKKEKSVVSFTYEQTIICRQLFAGHVVVSRPMKRKKNLQRMIINIWCYYLKLSVRIALCFQLRVQTTESVVSYN